MKFLSLFHGIGCLNEALSKTDINVSQIYSAEIDMYANKLTSLKHPSDINFGNVLNWKKWDLDWQSIEFVCAGFPCQAWSVAGLEHGDKDPRGALFWTTLEIIAHVLNHNPSARFLMENVKMKKDFEEYITLHTEQVLGSVHKKLINSLDVLPQNRERYYWSNFEISDIEKNKTSLLDILERGEFEIRPCKRINDKDFGHVAETLDIKGQDCIKRVYHPNGYCPTLTTMGGGHREPKILVSDTEYRKMTVLEMERAQGLSDNYTNGFSDTQRKKMIGNGWSIPVISHILKCAFGDS